MCRNTCVISFLILGPAVAILKNFFLSPQPHHFCTRFVIKVLTSLICITWAAPVSVVANHVLNLVKMVVVVAGHCQFDSLATEAQELHS